MLQNKTFWKNVEQKSIQFITIIRQNIGNKPSTASNKDLSELTTIKNTEENITNEKEKIITKIQAFCTKYMALKNLLHLKYKLAGIGLYSGLEYTKYNFLTGGQKLWLIDLMRS